MTVGLSKANLGVVLRLLLTERPACSFPKAQAGKESQGLERRLLGRPTLRPASAPVRASGNGHFLLYQEIHSLTLRKGLEPFQLRGSFSVKSLGYAQSLEYSPGPNRSKQLCLLPEYSQRHVLLQGLSEALSSFCGDAIECKTRKENKWGGLSETHHNCLWLPQSKLLGDPAWRGPSRADLRQEAAVLSLPSSRPGFAAPEPMLRA